MITKYRIDAWCVCENKTMADQVFNWLVSNLQQQKSNNNILTGNVTKNENIETESESQGV